MELAPVAGNHGGRVVFGPRGPQQCHSGFLECRCAASSAPDHALKRDCLRARAPRDLRPLRGNPPGMEQFRSSPV
ncbi:hypothetical protein NDU88_001001 [Pleurodeles waltl]|uniref:Uncharacterized protein n=1 Tax=Pleurodeles waltl TaxID=8319 RepID=A0AAV7VWB1_PLEWA|nr:hypothetical protein NDU88_001001 [Pleurodeles waltl]